jgi:hypothetical protein
LVLHLLIASAAVILMRERWANLLMVPIDRVVYEPLRVYLLYTSTYLAVRGVKLGWNKLQRTGALDTVIDLHGPNALGTQLDRRQASATSVLKESPR